ncbi:Type II secretion system protein E [compost metagenome]
MISEINHGVDKIITIEDPVEYQLPGVLQIPVNEKKGLTFARGLRSILRHDPDKILVGEIRDPDTAQIAVQSALTGHLVFTTIHANNVFDVIGRFSQMQVDPYSFVSALNAILAQRLIRLACPHCATACEVDDETLQASGLTRAAVVGWTFVRAQGCGQCRGSGYRGRSAIAELLHLDDDLRQMIVERRPLSQIKTLACQRGLRLLRASALDLVRDGRTTLEEINRVTFIA